MIKNVSLQNIEAMEGILFIWKPWRGYFSYPFQKGLLENLIFSCSSHIFCLLLCSYFRFGFIDPLSLSIPGHHGDLFGFHGNWPDIYFKKFYLQNKLKHWNYISAETEPKELNHCILLFLIRTQILLTFPLFSVYINHGTSQGVFVYAIKAFYKVRKYV